MGKTYTSISAPLQEWITAQKMFFVSTAPLSPDGTVNCSPKGLDTLRVIDERTVAYLDLTGSGVETIAHLQENGRITVMLCAFEGPPQILRLIGQGEVITKDMNAFASLQPLFPDFQGIRSIIKIDIHKFVTSCGFAVPLYEYQGQRDVLLKWAEHKGPEGIKQYVSEKNRVSVDGLPGIG